MNNDPHNDLARYHGFPPLSPPHEPTPTIPQMEGRHERDERIDQAKVYLKWAWITIGGVVLAVFAVALIYRATVGVY
jgi:hypothetical protein